LASKEDGMRIKKWLATALANRKSEVLGKSGTPYLMGIVKMVKTELHLDVTRQTIATYLKEDLTRYLEMTTHEYSDEIVEYDYMMNSARQIWDNEENIPADRTKAYNSYLKAKKQREELERKLQAERIREAEVQRPNYLISFEPKSALRKCPECGHEFYDGVEKVKKDEGKTKPDED